MKKSEIQKVSGLFKLASDPLRLTLIDYLGEGSKNVTELCELSGGSQPTVSQHLAFLRASSVVTNDRKGKHNYYSLTDSGRTILDAAKTLAG